MSFNEFVSEIYLNEKLIKRMKESYFSSGEMLRLDGLFNQIRYEALLSRLKELKWQHRKISDRFSYDSFGNVNELREIFLSDDFKEFLSGILGSKVIDANFEVLRFGHGDYTLMHDNEKLGERIEWFMFFSDFWDETFGGQIVYSRFDSVDESFVFPVAGNSFILIKKARDLGRFVKYINHLVGKKKLVLVLGRVDVK